LGCAEQSELQLESVAVEGCFAHHLREAALALPAQQVHLEQAEPSVHVARGKKKVVVGLRHDVAGPVGFERHIDRPVEPGQAQRLAADCGVGGHGPGPGHGVERGS
jgi:hypothetical protein